jgi:uncharacterized phage infection (PIP) family protein YhgE
MKFLLILSTVLMIFSIVFAWQSRNDFVQVRQSAQSSHVELNRSLINLKKLTSESEKLVAQVSKANDELSTEQERVKSQKLKAAQAQNDTKRAEEELNEVNGKRADLRLKLDKLPQGMKPETMQEEINNMKKETGEIEAQVELKKKEVDAEEAKVEELRGDYASVMKKISDRKKSFDRNGMSARVVAVNRDWGFVVIDAGENRGISEASKLLVTRGQQTVGKLAIVSVQGRRTVANILPNTLAPGMEIAPGDRVILENLYQ